VEHILADLDKTLSVQQALWSVPLCLTLHNVEEALGVQKLVPLLRQMLPWFRLSARQFFWLLVLVTLAVWAIAVFAAPTDRLVILLGIQAVLFQNVFVPHFLLSARLRRYTPGVATAVLLILPASFYLLHRISSAS
jgi:Protein of unknown function with HXXEE motif